MSFQGYEKIKAKKHLKKLNCTYCALHKCLGDTWDSWKTGKQLKMHQHTVYQTVKIFY